tara:strand:+ start:238 stop:462 length:225 start_codon:yes stop_codon:yes gene_type:complete
MRDSAKKVQRTTSKLASGSRITRAGDDAAGAAISKNMREELLLVMLQQEMLMMVSQWFKLLKVPCQKLKAQSLE